MFVNLIFPMGQESWHHVSQIWSPGVPGAHFSPQRGSSSHLMEGSQNLPACPCGVGVLTQAMAFAGAYTQPPVSIHSTAVCFPPRGSRNASQALNPLRASVFLFVFWCGFFFFPFYKIEVWLIYNVAAISAV